MKLKVKKKNYGQEENFDRKAKRKAPKKDKSSKRKLSIYDDFEDEDLDDYQLGYDEEE